MLHYYFPFAAMCGVLIEFGGRCYGSTVEENPINLGILGERCPGSRTVFETNAKINNCYWGKTGLVMNMLDEYSIPGAETRICKTQRKRRA